MALPDEQSARLILIVYYSAQETYEQKRQDHLREMQAKEEQMRQMFVQKVCSPALWNILSNFLLFR